MAGMVSRGLRLESAPMNRTMKISLLGFVLFLVGCDHATKLAAERTLQSEASAVLPRFFGGLLELRYTRKPDVAFGLFERLAIPHQSWVLVAFASAATLAVLVMWWSRRKEASMFEHFAWAATVSGALGNVLDRIGRGYVVDFLRLPHWPIFNVADVCVVAGVVGLVVCQLRLITSARV